MDDPCMTRFEPPTIKQRGSIARAVASGMHEAGEAIRRGETAGRLTCRHCGGFIRWSGGGGRTEGTCVGCREVRWP